MNQRIQNKIEEYKKMASSHKGEVKPVHFAANRPDSLSSVIRSKKEADVFMAELEGVIKRLR